MEWETTHVAPEKVEEELSGESARNSCIARTHSRVLPARNSGTQGRLRQPDFNMNTEHSSLVPGVLEQVRLHVGCAGATPKILPSSHAPNDEKKRTDPTLAPEVLDTRITHEIVTSSPGSILQQALSPSNRTLIVSSGGQLVQVANITYLDNKWSLKDQVTSLTTMTHSNKPNDTVCSEISQPILSIDPTKDTSCQAKQLPPECSSRGQGHIQQLSLTLNERSHSQETSPARDLNFTSLRPDTSRLPVSASHLQETPSHVLTTNSWSPGPVPLTPGPIPLTQVIEVVNILPSDPQNIVVATLVKSKSCPDSNDIETNAQVQSSNHVIIGQEMPEEESSSSLVCYYDEAIMVDNPRSLSISAVSQSEPAWRHQTATNNLKMTSMNKTGSHMIDPRKTATVLATSSSGEATAAATIAPTTSSNALKCTYNRDKNAIKKTSFPSQRTNKPDKHLSFPNSSAGLPIKPKLLHGKAVQQGLHFLTNARISDSQSVSSLPSASSVGVSSSTGTDFPTPIRDSQYILSHAGSSTSSAGTLNTSVGVSCLATPDNGVQCNNVQNSAVINSSLKHGVQHRDCSVQAATLRTHGESEGVAGLTAAKNTDVTSVISTASAYPDYSCTATTSTMTVAKSAGAVSLPAAMSNNETSPEELKWPQEPQTISSSTSTSTDSRDQNILQVSPASSFSRSSSSFSSSSSLSSMVTSTTTSSASSPTATSTTETGDTGRRLRARNQRKFLPEKTRQKRQTLQDMTRPLKQWLVKHRDNPYPSKLEKMELVHSSNMSLTQVSNWFANARRRLKNTVRGDDVSWAKRIREYNQYAEGNAELFSIPSSSEDNWDSDTEDIATDRQGPHPQPEPVHLPSVTPGPTLTSPTTALSSATTPSNTRWNSPCLDDQQGGYPKYKNSILQRYLHDASQSPLLQDDSLGTSQARHRHLSSSTGSHDFEYLSTSSVSSPSHEAHHDSFDEFSEEFETITIKRRITENQTVCNTDDMYWKEIGAALALTSLARSHATQ